MHDKDIDVKIQANLLCNQDAVPENLSRAIAVSQQTRDQKISIAKQASAT